MTSPTTKAPVPVLIPVPPAVKPSPLTSNTADYVYRIAAMTAGIALLMTVV